MKTAQSPIGIFDSGYGGLTILEEIRQQMPHYDYLYLGDNARTPYGTRSFEVVYEFTRQAVLHLFDQGCELVILACNTASAKALRSIQQNDLPRLAPHKRVLGVIRPTVELVGTLTQSNQVGILGTTGTVQSDSYPMEIAKLYPHIQVYQEACPMWVPLVENNQHLSPGADYFVKESLTKLFGKSPTIDTLILGCTHYPLLLPKIANYVPEGVTILSQGEWVAKSLENYLERHPEMEQRLSRGASCRFQTSEAPEKFGEAATLFLRHPIVPQRITLE